MFIVYIWYLEDWRIFGPFSTKDKAQRFVDTYREIINLNLEHNPSKYGMRDKNVQLFEVTLNEDYKRMTSGDLSMFDVYPMSGDCPGNDLLKNSQFITKEKYPNLYELRKSK